MKGCVHIDETVSMEEPRYKKKNKELHKKMKKKSMEDKELDTYRKDYRYGEENDDDEDEDFPWEDGIERIEHVSKGEKIKSTPWDTEKKNARTHDQNDGKVEDQPETDDEHDEHEHHSIKGHQERSKRMPKGKRKVLVMMLAKKKMRHHKDDEY